jgi:hypothetical protein
MENRPSISLPVPFLNKWQAGKPEIPAKSTLETLSWTTRTNAQPFPVKRVHRLAGFGFRNAFGAESQKRSWNP